MLDLINAYENYLTKVKQASANTVFSYLRDVRQFSGWLREQENLDVVDAAQVNISGYLDHLRGDGRSAATILVGWMDLLVISPFLTNILIY